MYRIITSFRRVNPFTNESQSLEETSMIDGDPRYRDEDDITYNAAERLSLRHSEVMSVVFIDRIVDEFETVIFERANNPALGTYSQSHDPVGLISIREGAYGFCIWRHLRPYANDAENAMNWLTGGQFWHPFEIRRKVYYQAVEIQKQSFQKGKRRFELSKLDSDSPSIKFGQWFVSVQSNDGKLALDFAYGQTPFAALRKAYKKQRAFVR